MLHGLPEQFPGLGLADDGERCADQLDAVFGQHAGFGQGHGGVEAGLPTERRQQGIGLFPGDDPGHRLRLDGLDVGAVGQAGIGHDGGGVGIDQDYLIAFFLEGLGSLGTGNSRTRRPVR